MHIEAEGEGSEEQQEGHQILNVSLLKGMHSLTTGHNLMDA
jgi:hypothetical protein